jgi:tripartite motif-containing protein 2/3/tripartite motif-containing protein 71
MEIQEALKKVKEPQKTQCEKCKKSRIATKFCRDCGKFVCEKCVEMHSEWDEFLKHEVVSMEQVQSNVKQLVPPTKKVTLYCSLHPDKELELYCETCGELICHNCTVNKHCKPEHKYDLVGDTFQQHKAEITASLEPVEKQLGVVSKALEQFDLRSYELDDLHVAIEGNIQQQIRWLQELLEARKAELTDQLQQLIQVKKKNLAAQKDEVEIVHAQLASCLSFVRESLRTGSQGEVMKMKKAVVKQIKEMTDNFKPDMLPPCEPANVKFEVSPELTQACQQFGRVFLQEISPKKCYATGKGLEVAKPGERATAVLHVVDQKGKVCSTPVETLNCELVSESTGKKIDCSVKKIEASGQYEISYQATSRGSQHQLHIKVEGEHIKGSPFPVTVKLPVQKLGTPIKNISGLKGPWGVAVNQRGEIVVAESSVHCISIFSPTGDKLRSFGSKGSGNGQFNGPCGVAVDDDGNILVADAGNIRIQKFTSAGKFIKAVGKRGNKQLEFSNPYGIAIHKKVYVSNVSNHCIQILNPDLTFSGSFGSYGIGNGQFCFPWDVACDSTGNVYVIDGNNDRIQVFTAAGRFVRKFAKVGSGSGELNWPSSISIDSEDVVYVAEKNNHRVSVFTSGGKFLTSFGTKGSGPGQFSNLRGIAVDKTGVVYVSDQDNNRLQLF